MHPQPIAVLSLSCSSLTCSLGAALQSMHNLRTLLLLQTENTRAGMVYNSLSPALASLSRLQNLMFSQRLGIQEENINVVQLAESLQSVTGLRFLRFGVPELSGEDARAFAGALLCMPQLTGVKSCK